jgi:putative membrane-bound dehydrogenase-like protein
VSRSGPGSPPRRALALAAAFLTLAGVPNATRAQGPNAEPPPTASAVRDSARLFSPDAADRARTRLVEIERETGVATCIETLNDIGGDPIEEFAARRSQVWGGSGAFILIDKKSRQFHMILTGPARDAIERGRRLGIRDAFLNEFRGGKFDEGLAQGVKAIALALAEAGNAGKLHRPASAAQHGGQAGQPLVQRNQVRLTLEGARLIIAGAEAKANEMKLKVNIAVVDDGGHLLAFARMDGARPASGYTAITKATTAATFRQETGPLPKGTTQPDPLLNLSLQNAAAASGGKVTTLYGGVPVTVDGQVIGGVGVGGGTGEQDAEVARAGIARFQSALGTTPAAEGDRKTSAADRPAPPATAAAREVIPHGQTRLPNPPLSPAEAIRKMTVPEGFTVELVASEPDLVNPVAMTFDERGRVWVTESLEYPRRSPGPGRDRVKVLEDTDGDGKADRFSVFAEGLNIPSGVAVGHGGVWVANAPDILFLQDTDGDGKADRREVVVTGFGREDTHELPNTLAWGPDGWLYGWNGVFNPSRVTHRGKTYDFTCAVFRIQPRTRDFEIFCEGTSNPWGLAWDNEGSAFASACVIDHLWHLVETGYYHRQGGPYPPFTWKIDSIVDHTHQKAAYCGIHFYDSDAYPPAYREKLYMGNIHGNCVNVDSLRRRGSTYAATAGPDFLIANDSWFMPVSQKTGPDGCLYVLDWYDRYHCYQDANRDPAGIDRLKGRLYRVRYEGTPRRWGFDLSRKTDTELIDLLGSPNGYDRDTARRLLAERPKLSDAEGLRSLALDREAPRRSRMNAFWTVISRRDADSEFLRALRNDPDPGFVAWAVRAGGNVGRLGEADLARLAGANDNPDVLLQLAIAAGKVEGIDPNGRVGLLADMAARCGDDPLIPHVVWQNLRPLLAEGSRASHFIKEVEEADLKNAPGLVALIPHAMERLLARPYPETAPLERLVGALLKADTDRSRKAAGACLAAIAEEVQSGELAGPRVAALREKFAAVLVPLLENKSDHPFRREAALLATSWKDPRGYPVARDAVREASLDPALRLQALSALIAAGEGDPLAAAAAVLDDPKANPVSFRGRVLAALGRLSENRVAAVVLERYARMEPDLRPRAVELLSQRPAWGRALLKAVGRGAIEPDAVNLNQVRKLLAFKDPELSKLVSERWGAVREERDPRRERVIRDVRALLRTTPGDPRAGAKVFEKVCAQCHKIYGEGQDVGPEITLNGRASYEQLLSNVLDPSLVIGPAYQATSVATTDGRVLTGLVVEKGDARVALKLQGGKVETIPADQVDELKTSPLSLMPEDLEKQLSAQEMADLFAFLTLDKPPGDPSAKRLPGAQELAR